VTRAIIGVSALLILCFAGLIVVVMAGREPEQLAVDPLLSQELTREIARSEEVRLAELTDFAWDRVLIVERGTPDDEISARLDEEWRGGVGFQTGDLLVFVAGGRVARYADYRGEGRFAEVERPIAEFAREDAVFEVRSLVITPKET
jgi:hypothetical protein